MRSYVLKKIWSQSKGFWLSYQKKCVWNIYVTCLLTRRKTLTKEQKSSCSTLNMFADEFCSHVYHLQKKKTAQEGKH